MDNFDPRPAAFNYFITSIPLDRSNPSTTTGDCTAGAPTGALGPTAGTLGPTGAGNSALVSKPTALGASKDLGSSALVGFLLRGFGLAVHCTTCAPGVLPIGIFPERIDVSVQCSLVTVGKISALVAVAPMRVCACGSKSGTPKWDGLLVY